MLYYLSKICISALLITLISEIAKRSSVAAALVASIPLVSLIATLWLYLETGDVAKVSTFVSTIFWLTLPSLTLFISMPLLLKHGVHFYLSAIISLLLTIGSYWLMLTILSYYGVKL